MNNPSSYKYLDQAPISLFFTSICNSTKINTNDVLGAVMSVNSTHPIAGIPALLANKNLGRIKISEILSTKEMKKFSIEIPLKGPLAVWSLLAADIEQISFVGSSRAKITLEEVKYNSTQRENKSISRAEQIIKDFSPTIEKGDKKGKILDFFSKLNFNPLEEQSVEKIICINKEKGLYGSPLYAKNKTIILVEGVSDIRTLLRAGYNNSISVNGYLIKETITEVNEIIKDKEEVIIFMDGDRGGKTILELLKEKIKTSNLKVIEEEDYGEVQLLTKLQIDSILSRRKSYTSSVL